MMDKRPPLTIAETKLRGERFVVSCLFCPFIAITPDEQIAAEITAEVHYISAHGENRASDAWVRPWNVRQAR